MSKTVDSQLTANQRRVLWRLGHRDELELDVDDDEQDTEDDD